MYDRTMRLIDAEDEEEIKQLKLKKDLLTEKNFIIDQYAAVLKQLKDCFHTRMDHFDNIY